MSKHEAGFVDLVVKQATRRTPADERDVIVTDSRETVAMPPLAAPAALSLGFDEAAAYVKLQNAAAKVARLEREFSLAIDEARRETKQALQEWSQFAKETT